MTGGDRVQNLVSPSKINDQDEEEDESFIYPSTSTAQLSSFRHGHPKPGQLESLLSAASSGNIVLLKAFFKDALENEEIEPFNLSNNASTRTGLTALHVAASRGHYEIVVWLIEECGAMPDLEDKEGETALHKASLNGHMPIVSFLVLSKADVHARDGDGWTALHNSCSKGYLDIVRFLCEKAGAAAIVKGMRGVDMGSNDGWTPLMNASSKGHLTIVLYLLTKQSANPLIRNKWGETAFDIAAAVFEVWICEILQQAEAEQWRGTTMQYNPLLVHTTIPLILYEHQRLDTRFKTVAVSGGRPRFTALGLGKPGRRSQFELKLTKSSGELRPKFLPASRAGVQLPLRESPWIIPSPATVEQLVLDGVERSHFWLSDWTLDVTPPNVDVNEGWQYARSFDDTDDNWTADIPMQLENILSGNSLISARFAGASIKSNSLSSNSLVRYPSWVRRRRWVRIMRRRLDIPPLAFLEPDGSLYHLDSEGLLVPYVEDPRTNLPSGEVTSTFFSSSQDYVSRARYLVGNNLRDNGASMSTLEVRRMLSKVERATLDLRQGILNDEDPERRTQAEVLLNTYSRDLERRRHLAESQGLLISDHDERDDQSEGDGSESDEEFHYLPTMSHSSLRPASRSSVSTEHFGPAVSRVADLTPQLTQSPDFRVPTNEAPHKILNFRWTPHELQPQWERDELVTECRDCLRRFNFINRRHCRKCGRIFCDRCSSYRAILRPSDVVQDPMVSEVTSTARALRVCHSCMEEISNNTVHRSYPNNMERIVVDQERLIVPGSLIRRHSSSQLSDLADCPVCNQSLDEIGDVLTQETHVKNCLEGNTNPHSGILQPSKYLVYSLPAESSLIGVECVICLEEFVKGSNVARLSCFCSFHNACLSSWLQRGKSCPVHAR